MPATSGPLAAAVPPGFAATPAWRIPIAAWSRSVATDGGTVLSRDREGHVVLVDPATGGIRWQSDETTTRDQDGPWLTTIDGRPAAAVVTTTMFSYWTLPTATSTETPGRGAAVGVPFPRNSTVSWVGPSPLITSPSGAVSVVRAGGRVPVTLPRGFRAVAADGTRVVAVAAGSWVRQAAGAARARARAIPRPRGAGTRPLRTEAVGAEFLLTVWPRSGRQGRHGQVVGLTDLATGRLVVQTALAAGVDLRPAGVLRETAGLQTLLGSVLVDTYTANIDLLDPRYSVRVVTRGHAWSIFRGRATDIHLNRRGDLTTVAFPAGEAALPVGVVASAGPRRRAVAVVAVPAGDGRILCGLPATG